MENKNSNRIALSNRLMFLFSDPINRDRYVSRYIKMSVIFSFTEIGQVPMKGMTVVRENSYEVIFSAINYFSKTNMPD